VNLLPVAPKSIGYNTVCEAFMYREEHNVRRVFGSLALVASLLGMFACGAFAQSQGLLNSIFNPGVTTINSASVLQSIERLSTLTTTRYQYANTFRVYRDMPPLIAALYGQEMILYATGYVTAGVDLSKIRAEDIQIDGSTLTINVPAPTLQDCFFDESTSEIIGERRALFQGSPQELQVTARRIVIANVRDNAIENGILTEAQAQAEEAITNFLSLSVGSQFTTIRVVVAAPNPNIDPALLPSSCRVDTEQ